MAKQLIEVPIPSMGATVNEITLIDLFCEAGSAVAKGEKLAELEAFLPDTDPDTRVWAGVRTPFKFNLLEKGLGVYS